MAEPSNSEKNKQAHRAKSKTQIDDGSIKRIDGVIASAKNLWFIFLSVIAFVVITLLSVDDIDFFGVDRNSALPLINVEVPTYQFFIAAPILILIVFIYMHSYLDFLWAEIGNSESQVKSSNLQKVVSPWLVTDALMQRSPNYESSDVTDRLFTANMRYWSSIFLMWGLGPLVLFFLWFRSTSAQDFKTTFLIAVTFLISVWIAAVSYKKMSNNMRLDKKAARLAVIKTVAVLLTVLVPIMTVIKTNAYFLLNSQPDEEKGPEVTTIGLNGDFWYSGTKDPLFPCKLPRKNPKFSKVPDFMKTARSWERQWRKNRWDRFDEPYGWVWNPTRTNLRQANVSQRPDNWQVEEDARRLFAAEHKLDINSIEFLQTWRKRRKLQIDQLKTPTLENRNFIAAYMPLAFIVGGQLEKSDFSYANLSYAILEEADLRRTILTQTNFRRAYMEGSDLRDAKLNGANFHETIMHHADIDEAKIEDTCFVFADLEAVDFQKTVLTNVSFFGSDLTNSEFVNTRFNQVGMQKARLSGIPSRTNKGEIEYLSFQLCRCDNEADLDVAKAFSDLDVTNAAFRYFDFQPMHEQYERTGDEKKYFDLTNGFFVGDANGNKVDTLQMSFGDGSNRFLSTTEGTFLVRPPHWPEKILTNDEFDACWRSWLVKNGSTENELYRLGLKYAQAFDWGSDTHTKVCIEETTSEEEVTEP